MAKTREQKKELAEKLAAQIEKTQMLVFTQITGFTMEDADALRAKGRDLDVDVKVTKKTALVHALASSGVELNKDQLSGSVLSAFGYSDQAAAPKMMAEFIKGREGMEILGGVMDGAFVEADMVKQLATLPSKPELYAKLVGTLNAPISGFVNVLAGNLRGLVRVLDAIKEAK